MLKTLRASKAGFPCARNIFYSVNGYEATTSERSQRIFDVGANLEPLVVDWLRKDGWSVDYNAGSQNAPLELTVPLNGGILAGHPDCFISRPEGLQNVLIDIKTMNDRAFTQWKREGSIASKPQYVDQLHIYAMGAITAGRKVEHLGIVGVNKNNSDMHIDIFDFNPIRANEISKRAEGIFALNEPPKDNCPAETWCCNYCEFSNICELYAHDTPQVIEPAKSNSDNPVIIEALSNLASARAIAKHAKEMEDNAKAVIDAFMKENSVTSLQAGGFVCSIKVRNSSRFDTASFKKVHPDLAGLFTVRTTSTSYDIAQA